MKRFLSLGIVLAALTTLGASAQAGHGFGWSGGHAHSNHGFHGTYVPQVYNYPTYHQTWHNTSHYDYHPGGFQRHGNHAHYVPGHVDLHRTGHFDGHLHN
ncbi:MAG: hypothetical protein KDA93_22100 [Planctomycetaceae bacterium]|nr:hypothetical protein [Planctomycetaceae bacterium]